MADVQQSEPDAESADAATCMPCRGTGAVVSYLGGESTSIPCPWCEGTGIRRSGVDAQARWLPARADGDGGPAEPGA